jgi:rod shape determining protein RodA
MDWILTAVMIVLTVSGVIFVNSACYAGEDGGGRALCGRQIVWATVGLAAYFSVAMIGHRNLAGWALWGYLLALVLLVVVLVAGPRIYGAKRWLFFFGASVQPSEIAKLATLLLLASVLSFTGLEMRSLSVVLLSLAIVGLPMLLIMKEPDLGTAMVFVPAALAMMFMAGVPVRYLAGLLILGLLLVALIVSAVLLPERFDLDRSVQERIWKITGLTEYQRTRVRVFLQPGHDPLGAGWSRRQSQIAVGSGGLLGKGLKKGTQNILGFLPRSVAPTDFIFSVIGEETGFVGAIGILSLYTVLFWRLARVAFMAQDSLGRLLCVGVLVLLFSHVFTNVGMTMGLMPVTGLPLPLISYGGSFIVITMTSLGVVQSVCVRSCPRSGGVVDGRRPMRTDVLR